MYFVSALPPRFFFVEVLVRLFEQFFHALAFTVIHGGADAGGNWRLLLVGGHCLVDAGEHTLRFFFARFRQHQGKFVSSVTRSGIDRAAVKPKNIGEAA